MKYKSIKRQLRRGNLRVERDPAGMITLFRKTNAGNWVRYV